MKIGLIQVDGKMPNLALLKLAKFHEEKGDDITYLDISSHKFDRIYGSKIFMGGSGYDLKQELPEDIELQVPDYENFGIDYSFGFTSRGCIRDCGFCIVKQKEGIQRDVNMDWVKGDKVLLIDNNFLASPKWKEKLQYFIDNKIKVCFNQGLDIRLITKEKAEMLSKVKYYDLKFNARRLYFAWDYMEYEEDVSKGIKLLLDAGVKPYHLMFYVLVGFNTTFEQDMYRFKKLDGIGAKPFIMLYNNCKDKRLRDFSRWANKRYYKVVKWEEYNKRNSHNIRK
jgi:hypothetical protein